MSKNKFYIFALLMMLPLISCSNKPKGDEIKTQFFEHKTEITELLKMQLEDSKVVRIVPTFTRLETSWAWPRKDIGFSEKRWNQY